MKQIKSSIDKLATLLLKTNFQTLIGKLKNYEKEEVKIKAKIDALISKNRKEKDRPLFECVPDIQRQSNSNSSTNADDSGGLDKSKSEIVAVLFSPL